MGTVGLLLAVSILGNALCYYHFDGAENPDMTFGDAVWYSVISVTTIGYGDYSAVSTEARIGTVIFIIAVGLGAFTVLVGLVIDWIGDMVMKGERGMGTVHASAHVLIVHFPSRDRVLQLVDEIQSDPGHRGREIVIISDQIEKLPFARENVLFVHGSSLSEDTYRRARAESCVKAIVLATSYSDANSDAVVASTVSVLDSVRSDIHIVAECLKEEHRRLFDSVRCDAVISALRITGNLLVQESQDPGVSRTIDVITSNLEGDTLFSAEVTELNGAADYDQVVGRLLVCNVNVISIVRGKETFTTFAKKSPAIGDRVIYLATRRYPWSELRQLAAG